MSPGLNGNRRAQSDPWVWTVVWKGLCNPDLGRLHQDHGHFDPIVGKPLRALGIGVP